jgi:hypothetical protein
LWGAAIAVQEIIAKPDPIIVKLPESCRAKQCQGRNQLVAAATAPYRLMGLGTKEKGSAIIDISSE